MEFWLKDNRTDGNELNKNQIIQLPVNPPSFEVTSAIGSSSFDVEGLGEVNFIGKKKLATISISSFFPAQNYNFCVCTPKEDPWEYVWIIENWQHWQSSTRFIITETNINMLCSVENFTYKVNAGSKDIEFTMELKEYRVLDESVQI
jgi:hypothetical protein